MERLAELLKTTVSDMIRHCAQQEHPELTPSDLLFKDMKLLDLEKLAGRYKDIGVIEDIYPLTPLQKGMLSHAIANPRDRAYVQQMNMLLEGKLDCDLMNRCWNEIVQRYDALRMNFVQIAGDQPVGVLYRSKQIGYTMEDIRHLAAEECSAYEQQLSAEDIKRGFDLECDPLIRLTILRTKEESYRMLWTFHHIMIDGWCMPIIAREVFQLYEALLVGLPSPLAASKPYRDYISWMEKRDQEGAADYWRQFLSGYEEISVVPGKKQEAEGTYEAQHLTLLIGEKLTRQMIQTVKERGITMNTLLQGAWGILLQRYNHAEDAVFGSVVSGRPAEIDGIETMIGLCINTIPVRVSTTSESTVASLLLSVQEQALASSSYDTYPLYTIQSFTEQREELIQNILVYQNYPVATEMKGNVVQGGHHIVLSEVQMLEQTSYNLNLVILPGDNLQIRFLYNARVYEPTMFMAIRDQLAYVLQQMVDDPQMVVNELELMTPDEQNCLIETFNHQPALPNSPSEDTIQELLEAQVQRAPDAAALVYRDNELTYSMLNKTTNRMAQALRKRGVLREHVVGVMMKRSDCFVLALLAIIKAGAAVLPIDPALPDNRVSYMLDDSKPVLLLTEDSLHDRDIARDGKRCMTYGELLEEAANESNKLSLPKAQPNDALYVIYTSGSTGTPKGVLLEQRTITNLIQAQHEGIDPVPSGEGTQVLQFASISFDVCYQEIFTALLNGACLHIASEECKQHPDALIDYVVSREIKTLFLPTSYLKYLASERRMLGKLSKGNLKHLIVAGEQLVVNSELRQFLEDTSIVLHNHYGPSESHVVTIASLGYPGTDGQGIQEVPTIGRPIAGVRIYILSASGKLQPPGIPGELCIAGSFLARGYIHQPELNAVKFVQDPFKHGERMYRTGDLARWHADGTIEYLGRIDQQVKIRGYRIELGEVEAQLLAIEGIREGAVIAREDQLGQNQLCAYYTGDRPFSTGELRTVLSRVLPSYMLPSYMVQLTIMPLTANGKIDHRSLPVPDFTQALAEYVAPVTVLEQQVTAIWSDVLGIERIGMEDHLVDLGVNSLSYMRAIVALEEELDIEFLDEDMGAGRFVTVSDVIRSIEKLILQRT